MNATADEPVYFCIDCFDQPTAWRVFWCQGRGDTRKSPHEQAKTDRNIVTICDCARTAPHYAHNYSDRCRCSDTNPNIRRARANAAAFQMRQSKKHHGGE